MSAKDDDANEAQNGAFMRALQRVVVIEPHELRSIAWSWLYFFSLLASTFVLATVARLDGFERRRR